jgi:hypothetical protein
MKETPGDSNDPLALVDFVAKYLLRHPAYRIDPVTEWHRPEDDIDVDFLNLIRSYWAVIVVELRMPAMGARDGSLEPRIVFQAGHDASRGLRKELVVL